MSSLNNKQDSVFIRTWKCSICRISIITFTSVLVLIFILSVLTNPVLNWVIKPQIVNSVNKNKNTHLQIDGINFSFFQNRLSFYNSIIILKDSSGSGIDTTIFSIPVTSVDGINWVTLIFEKGYSSGDLIIEKPFLKITSYIDTHSNNKKKDSENQDNKTADSSLAQKLVKLFPGNFSPLSIGSIYINDASIVRLIQAEDKTIDSVKNLSLIISDINLDKNLNYSKDNVSLISDIELSVKGVHKKMFGPGYDFKIESINYSSGKSDLVLKNINFQPYISDSEFFKGDKYRRDRLILKIPEVVLTKTNLLGFFNENLLTVNTISIPDFHIEIFTNRTVPIDPSTDPKMPHQLISSLGFYIEVEKFETDNSSLILESIMPEVDRRAHLEFTKVKTTISNISNTPEKQSYNNPCIIEVSGLLQKEGRIELKLNYNLLSENLDFNYKGSMGEMNVPLLNSHLEVEDKASIKSGEVIKANFSTTVNNGISKVNLIPLYQNLQIEILEEESIEKSELKTFIAGTQIRESNPNEKGKIKSANVNYKRNPDNTFMDVIWLALSKGLGEVVGF